MFLGNAESMSQITLQADGKVSAYPERPGQPDCGHYLRTGFCGYGINCRFNHPATAVKQVHFSGFVVICFLFNAFLFHSVFLIFHCSFRIRWTNFGLSCTLLLLLYPILICIHYPIARILAVKRALSVVLNNKRMIQIL